MSSKRGNKNHYKGKGAASTGHHTRKGGYRLLPWKLPDYVVPDLTGFQVRRRAGRRATRAARPACAASRVLGGSRSAAALRPPRAPQLKPYVSYTRASPAVAAAEAPKVSPPK